ncbi:MAG: ribose-5-phosphate isomerase RpiA [Gammaproteobacteria bacterium]|nr:ribose-5-phosphate isomerase RpiA [Gammaproteobacteria bacterium]
MNDKQKVAIHAAQLIQNDMIVGLGTGSTANYFIEELARKHHQQGLHVQCVASSIVSTIKAQELGLPVVSIEHISRLDIYVDGADEVTNDKILLKGRGYDLVKEKVLAKASDRFLVLADKTKLVSYIGQNYPIPVEVMPFAWKLVLASIEKVGGQAQLRANSAGDGLAISSHGSLVLDARFPDTISASELNHVLSSIPGVVEHGVFESLASTVFVADNGHISEM